MDFIPGPQGCEFVDAYTEGGYHPVTIGDEFDNGRYKVLHKLGAGGFATVWLARDNIENINVAFKICMADSSALSQEVKLYLHLEKKAAESQKQSYVAMFLDAFWHVGPNGVHRCIVTEIGGPSLASIRDKMKIRPDFVRGISAQLLEALQELHGAGIVFGDLTPANVLVRSVGIDILSEQEIYDRFGYPEPIVVRPLKEGIIIDEHVPKFVYDTIDTKLMRVDMIEDPQVMLIDFGEAYIVDDDVQPRDNDKSADDPTPAAADDGDATIGDNAPGDEDAAENGDRPAGFANNLSYASPESIVMDERATQASDIWALACIMFELRSGEQLFTEGGGSVDFVRTEMIDTLGRMPVKYLQKVLGDEYDPEVTVNREKVQTPSTPPTAPTMYEKIKHAIKGVFSLFRSISKEANLAEEQTDPISLAGRIAKIGTWEPWCSMTRKERIVTYKKYLTVSGHPEDEVPEDVLYYGGPPPERLTPLEKTDFTDLLTSMLKWLPEDRPSLEELAKHPYFHRYYLAEMTGPWLQKFHWGLKLGVRIGDRETVIC